MPKYRVRLQTIAHTEIEVEAASMGEAADAALEQAQTPRLCAHCSGGFGGQSLEVSGEWDIGQDMTLDNAIVEIGEQ